MKQFAKLHKLSKGNQVAIISPSAGLPGLFPWVLDLGIQRLQDVFNLRVKEYPTTRQMGSSLEDRARDIMAAFSDPENKAVFASIGGEDQIKLIKMLDHKVFQKNPKPFFGFSDNTHLHNYLWNLGIPSYYGANVMTELAFQEEIPEMTVAFLKQALFEEGNLEVNAAKQYCDIGLNWADEQNLHKKRQFEPNDGHFWEGEGYAEGILWGGCVESLIVQCTSNKYLPSKEDLKGTILYIETAEDIPEPWIVDYLLTGFGERGYFDEFKAVLVGRPKAWEFDKQYTAEQKSDYKKQQRETIIRTIREYNREIPIVQNLDFGHTAPQIVVPSGNLATVDAVQKKITFLY